MTYNKTVSHVELVVHVVSPQIRAITAFSSQMSSISVVPLRAHHDAWGTEKMAPTLPNPSTYIASLSPNCHNALPATLCSRHMFDYGRKHTTDVKRTILPTFVQFSGIKYIKLLCNPHHHPPPELSAVRKTVLQSDVSHHSAFNTTDFLLPLPLYALLFPLPGKYHFLPYLHRAPWPTLTPSRRCVSLAPITPSQMQILLLLGYRDQRGAQPLVGVSSRR